jgi:N-formylglutamate deformylase
LSFVEVHRGTAPLLISLPHTGTEIPDAIAGKLVSRETALRDTDWRVDALYAFARELGATLVRTPVSRTVVDVNRDPSGATLYPGQATTGLIPVETFDGEPLYRPGEEPGAGETEERRRTWFEPYHAALAAEIERLQNGHGRIVVYDCHSIRSRVPRLFPGELPVFNVGTNGGTSCDALLEDAVAAACRQTGESTVLNGRFRGGWITRHYGRPQEGVHAIQMELAQRFYMDEERPDVVARERAAGAAARLERIVRAALDWVTE